jgi:hypothetical protein
VKQPSKYANGFETTAEKLHGILTNNSDIRTWLSSIEQVATKYAALFDANISYLLLFAEYNSI